MIVYGIVVAVSCLIIVWLMSSAPEGHEDENGFHYHEDPHGE